MKEKLSNGCISIAITVIPFAMLWGAISMFKHGEYIKGSICVLGALLFGIPIFIGWFSRSNSIKEDKPSVPRLPLPATKREFDISSMQLFCFYQLSLCSFLASLATDCMQ